MNIPEFAGAIATIAGAFQGGGQQPNSALLSAYLLLSPVGGVDSVWDLGIGLCDSTVKGTLFDCCPPPWKALAMVAIVQAPFIIILKYRSGEIR